MEAAERSLHSACASERIAAYEVDRVLWIFREVARRVQTLHAAGLVHGDLKQRNILRVDTGRRYKKWILCDGDACARVGKPVGYKSSSGYAPPELARVKFSKCGGRQLAQAAPNFDVWSLGVILFELCAGRTLFAQDTSNDELVDTEDRARLCCWDTMTDEELAPVFDEPDTTDEDPNVVIKAKDLIRWCLKGSPEDRPTLPQILNHPLLTTVRVISAMHRWTLCPTEAALVCVDVQGAYVKRFEPACRPTEPGAEISLRPMRYHGFMSHAQVNLYDTWSPYEHRRLGAVRDPNRCSGFSRQFWTSSVTQSVSFASVTGGRVRHSRDPILRV